MKRRLLCLVIAAGVLGVSVGCLYPGYGRRRDEGPYERRDRRPEPRRDRDRDDRHDDRHQPASGLPH